MESPAPGLVCRHGRRRWQRPQQGVLKLNVDGSFKIQEASGGWGYVIRYESGAVIQSAGWGRKDFACSPLHMELLACLQGLGAAIQLGIQNLELETDAKQVVEAVHGNEFRLSLVGGLVHEVKELLAENFMQPLVKHAPRECNHVAHELAALGSKSEEAQPSVLAGVPERIMFLVSGDLADMVDQWNCEFP